MKGSRRKKALFVVCCSLFVNGRNGKGSAGECLALALTNNEQRATNNAFAFSSASG